MTGWRGALLWKRLWKELAKQLRAELAIARSSLDTVERERESRIAALAAELETTKARSQHNHDCSVRDANARAAAEEALATERAAREKAEKEAAQYKLWWDETSKSHDATNAHLERAEHERNEHAKHRANLDRKNQELSRENERLVDYASGCQRERDTLSEAFDRAHARELELERERDTALARVKELERAQISPDAYMPREEVARLGIAQKALADWENGLPEPWRTYVMRLETNANPSGNIRDAFCQRQNAEACALRAKAVESALASALAREERTSRALTRELDRRLAVESALASARELPALWRKQADEYPRLVEAAYAGAGVKSCADELEKALSSAPSPAPERSDKRSRWNELGELPVTVMATSEYPSPAPCSGCAAARELLVLWYHARGFAESGETVDAVTLAWLKEHGE